MIESFFYRSLYDFRWHWRSVKSSAPSKKALFLITFVAVSGAHFQATAQTEFEYDELGRLKSAEYYDAGAAIIYHYDATGNRSQIMTVSNLAGDVSESAGGSGQQSEKIIHVQTPFGPVLILVP